MRFRTAAPFLCILLLALPLSGCKTARALRGLQGVELVRVEGLYVSPDAVSARVLLRWPEHSGTVCVQSLEWEAGAASLSAVPEGPCSSPDRADPPSQWLAVTASPEALGALASGKQPGSSLLRAEVDGFALSLQGQVKPRLRLAEGATAQLDGALGMHSARLEVLGLPPTVRVRIALANPLQVDLETAGARWEVRVDGRPLAAGPLDVPELLRAGEAFEVAVDLDPETALGIALGGFTGKLTALAELAIQTPWGLLQLHSSLDL